MTISKLVRKVAILAWKHTDAKRSLDGLIEQRYGVHPSDVDCDNAIDALDYGLSPDYTLEHLDNDMKELGYDPLTK